MDRTADCYMTTNASQFGEPFQKKPENKTIDDCEMDAIYSRHMKKKNEFERKMWEKRKEKYVKDEIEYNEM